MGKLYISKQLIGTEIQKVVFKFLRIEHKATISRKFKDKGGFFFIVEGNDIPKAEKEFTVFAIEIVQKVIQISIQC